MTAETCLRCGKDYEVKPGESHGNGVCDECVNPDWAHIQDAWAGDVSKNIVVYGRLQTFQPFMPEKAIAAVQTLEYVENHVLVPLDDVRDIFVAVARELKKRDLPEEITGGEAKTALQRLLQRLGEDIGFDVELDMNIVTVEDRL